MAHSDSVSVTVSVAGAVLPLSVAESHAGVPLGKLQSSPLRVSMPPFVMSATETFESSLE